MQLAQVNIGRLLAPLDTPQLSGFVAALEPINALADAAPGFVWRLQTEDGDATAIRTPHEALDRLAHLRARGPTPTAFTFRAPFDLPEAGGTPGRAADDWLCPT